MPSTGHNGIHDILLQVWNSFTSFFVTANIFFVTLISHPYLESLKQYYFSTYISLSRSIQVFTGVDYI
jgi:hypothetical protein